MPAVYSGLSVVGWHLMIDSWWDKVSFFDTSALGPANSDVKVLAGFLLFSIVIGSIFVLYRIYRKVNKYLRVSSLVYPLGRSLALDIILTVDFACCRDDMKRL
jgi:hypothetical protein